MGWAPADWACPFGHHAVEVFTALFDETGVGPGVALLDVVCGNVLAIRHAVDHRAARRRRRLAGVVSGGPIAPALRAGDVEVIHRDLLAGIDHRRDRSGIYHSRNDRFVIARAA